MVAAIRQTVRVDQDGRIEIRSPEFRTGAVAEVIVLMRQPSENGNADAVDPLVALDKLQAALRLDPTAADQWVQNVNAERRSR